MALIDDNSCCSLCGGLLGDSSNWLATTMVGLQPPLSRMVDCAAHHACLAQWEHKRAFVQAYNSALCQSELIVSDDGSVRHTRLDRPLIAWHQWLAMTVLLPASLVYNGVAWVTGSFRRQVPE
jgi:hypothetical protein